MVGGNGPVRVLAKAKCACMCESERGAELRGLDVSAGTSSAGAEMDQFGFGGGVDWE